MEVEGFGFGYVRLLMWWWEVGGFKERLAGLVMGVWKLFRDLGVGLYFGVREVLIYKGLEDVISNEG